MLKRMVHSYHYTFKALKRDSGTMRACPQYRNIRYSDYGLRGTYTKWIRVTRERETVMQCAPTQIKSSPFQSSMPNRTLSAQTSSTSFFQEVVLRRENKAIPVTGCGDPFCCVALWLPHFLDNRLTDGGEVVSLTRRPPFTRRKIPGTLFC
jgi:hypothetical protein